MSEKKGSIKVNISGGNEGPGKGLSRMIEIDEKKMRFDGMKLGDIVKGGTLGFPNYEFQITGGSDSSGFPMRRNVHGPVKKRILVVKRGIGYKPVKRGEKHRRTVRGNEITPDMTLINMKVVKYGEAELFKKKEGEEKGEKKGEKEEKEGAKKEKGRKEGKKEKINNRFKKD